ncbi:MAG: HEPN domain-containing protein [Methanobacteriota archaeon]|nr:MAG: HEPN domain-containing protein [Euryarchaeota archaeon]
MKDTTRAWLQYAESDLLIAKTLLNTLLEESSVHLAPGILFHSQQVVEKCFKALLVEAGKSIPKIHSIIKLYELLPPEAQQAICITENEKENFDDIYIDVRYPGEQGLLPHAFPSMTRAKEMFATAERVIQDVFRYLNIPPSE